MHSRIDCSVKCVDYGIIQLAHLCLQLSTVGSFMESSIVESPMDGSSVESSIARQSLVVSAFLQLRQASSNFKKAQQYTQNIILKML